MLSSFLCSVIRKLLKICFFHLLISGRTILWTLVSHVALKQNRPPEQKFPPFFSLFLCSESPKRVVTLGIHCKHMTNTYLKTKLLLYWSTLSFESRHVFNNTDVGLLHWSVTDLATKCRNTSKTREHSLWFPSLVQRQVGCSQSRKDEGRGAVKSRHDHKLGLLAAESATKPGRRCQGREAESGFGELSAGIL